MLTMDASNDGVGSGIGFIPSQVGILEEGWFVFKQRSGAR
jgi:hypothetical protein